MSAVGQRLKRYLIAFLVVCVTIGVLPQSHARAWAPPVPVAPPVTGLCTTPVGVILCIAGAGAAVVGSLWAADRIAGWSPQEDGTWDWCEYDGVLAAIECLDGGNPPPIPSGDWSDLLPEVTGYKGTWMTEPVYLVADPADNAALLDAYGIWIAGGVIGPLTDGRSGLRMVISMHRTASAAEWCPEVHIGPSVGNPAPAAWAAASPCITMTGPQSTQRYGGSVTGTPMVNCSSGTKEMREWQGGGRIVAEAWCEGGTATQAAIWRGAGHPDSVLNLYTTLESCNVMASSWSWSGTPRRDCSGIDFSHGKFTVRIRGGEPAEVMTVAVTDCRAPDGTVTTRISNGEAVPSWETEVPPAPSGCLAGELPMRTTISVCEVEDLTSCKEVADIAVPTIPPELDLECLYRLASDNPCSMWLEKWNGTAWEECVPDDNCVGWWEAPNRETHYRCGWGGNYLAASQCVPLKDFYDGEDEAVVVQNPTNPNPDPTAGGDPVQIGGPVPPVSAQPTKTWYGRIIREWSTGTIEGMNYACWPQGWGLLNPLQWVLRPIMCALAWAFVPTGVTLEGLVEESLESLQESPTLKVVTTLVTMPGDFLTAFGAAAGSAGCGLVASIPLAPDFSVDLVIIPCAEPHFVEAAGIIKPILSASIMAGALMGGIRLAVGAHFQEED